MSLSGMVETSRLYAKYGVISRRSREILYQGTRPFAHAQGDSLIVEREREVIVGFWPTGGEPRTSKLGVSQFSNLDSVGLIR